MGCFSCSKLLYIAILVLITAYLGYVIAFVPVYRYVAIIGILLLIAFKFSVWRFLPSEKAYVREKAKAITDKRLAFVAPAATV
ncbi:hypothetical protein DQ04_12961020 [Trypanosoma grayi]|uniref:hypothetical protein n=1 Tax=Trypanosoma grayi TaxID=71804 RepID=UPI0004F4937F|nr:hypothetical protein DQ04_12961020 [Trypanosoma grayi]KEG06643.1 hypothetical protein DQ04_12961020 [Trypanosoma grayi]